MTIQTVLIKDLEEMNQFDALDMEDFTPLIQNEYTRNPYFGVCDTKLAMASTPINAQNIETLFKVLDKLEDDDFEDIRDIAKSAAWNNEKDCWTVELIDPIYNSTKWNIKK